MEYKVVVGGSSTPEGSTQLLAERVNQALKEGWELVGGVSLSLIEAKYFMACQAMRQNKAGDNESE